MRECGIEGNAMLLLRRKIINAAGRFAFLLYYAELGIDPISRQNIGV
jgi:hypothetical protein